MKDSSQVGSPTHLLETFCLLIHSWRSGDVPAWDLCCSSQFKQLNVHGKVVQIFILSFAMTVSEELQKIILNTLTF